MQDANVFLLDFSKSHLKVVLLRPYLFFGQKVRFPHFFTSRLMCKSQRFQPHQRVRFDLCIFTRLKLRHCPVDIVSACEVLTELPVSIQNCLSERTCWPELDLRNDAGPPVKFALLNQIAYLEL